MKRMIRRITGTAIALSLILLLAIGCAGEVPAGTLLLPEGLTLIDEEAFAGDPLIRSAVLPDTVTGIGSQAFADTGLYTITIPESVETIAGDAFDGITVPLLIEAEPDSAAAAFALGAGLDFRAGTVFRAFVVGQTDYPDPYSLIGPDLDSAAIGALLEDRYSVTISNNLTAEEILEGISETFSGATDADISLFFYSGHGLHSNNPDYNGALVGIEANRYVTAAALRNALDKIPGRKIILLDSCYSGALIGKSVNSTAEPPAVSFLRAFTKKSTLMKKGSSADCYYIMVSSSGTELSIGTYGGGIFTNAFIESAEYGDADGDGIITLEESYEYTADAVNDLLAPYDEVQSVQVYPEDCFQFGLFR